MTTVDRIEFLAELDRPRWFRIVFEPIGDVCIARIVPLAASCRRRG